MTGPLTFVSVDLDDLACYRTIYGLPAEHDATDLVLERCLPRFLDLFAALGVRGTFFVIGRTLDADRDRGGQGRAMLRRAIAEGHELANHSHAHDYALTRCSPSVIEADLRRCHAALEALGADVCGFRAPGYTHDAGLRRALVNLGYRYDSSLLPSWPYAAAKSAMRVLLRSLGRRSGSLPSSYRAFRGNRVPFRWPCGLWEVPIGVGPFGLPLIGTTLLAAPEPLARFVARRAERSPYLHIELHGLDLVDPEHDDIPANLRRLPELRVGLAEKLDRLARLLRSRPAISPLADWVRAQ